MNAKCKMQLCTFIAFYLQDTYLPINIYIYMCAEYTRMMYMMNIYIYVYVYIYISMIQMLMFISCALLVYITGGNYIDCLLVAY